MCKFANNKLENATCGQNLLLMLHNNEIDNYNQFNS